MIRNGIRFLLENSLFLIGGSLLALVWANVDEHSYHGLLHFAPLADESLNLHFLVNDFLMALFFGIAAKEVRESFLKGGALEDPRRAIVPLLATVGGVVVPALVYVGGAALCGSLAAYGRGWAIPSATDIAFSYMVARFIFGPAHSAIAFLLLLAIVDDGIGLAILAIFYPQHAIHPEWLLLVAGAVAAGVMFYQLRLHSFWWYLLGPGLLSWYGFYQAGLHPALGLVPIIATMPHAHTDWGIFGPKEMGRHDTLNEFEHWWKNPVQLILGLFGLCNAGVVFSSIGTATWLVLAGLLIGKPVGITLFALLGRLFGLQLPEGMTVRHLIVVGMVAGIGFTVALFVSVSAFPAGEVQSAARMGALLSFAAVGLSIGIARLFGIVRQKVEEMEVVLEPEPEPALELV